MVFGLGAFVIGAVSAVRVYRVRIYAQYETKIPWKAVLVIAAARAVHYYKIYGG